MSLAYAAAALVAIGTLAFTVEAAVGFGATLITLALGSFVVDSLDTLLLAFLPVNLVLSTRIAARHRALVRRDVLLGVIVPGMLVGVPFGIALAHFADGDLLKRLFGVFIVLLSAIELWRGRNPAPPVPLARGARLGYLFAGGVIHGAFTTGGPMAVYVTSRLLPDKGEYRATLAALWTILNVIMLVWLVATHHGALREASTWFVALLPSVVVGLVVGELVHRKVPAESFRLAVYALLALVGIALVVR